MSTDADAKRRRIVIGGLIAVALIIVLLLLLRGCGPEKPKRPDKDPDREEKPYLIPRHLALKFDRDGIIEYCRDTIRPASYEGVLRGAFGALWAQEANAWDRALLAAAGLEAEGVEARVVSGDADAPPRLAYRDDKRWVTVRLDAAEAELYSDEPPLGAVAWTDLAKAEPESVHHLSAAFNVHSGETSRRVGEMTQPVAQWLHQPAIIEVKAGKEGLQYELRIGAEVSRSGPLGGATRVELELTWRFRAETKTWRRDLYDNVCKQPGVPGRAEPRAGDRYAVVVTAGPLVDEVPAAREFMFDSSRETPLAQGPARTLIAVATKYQVESDERARRIAKETGSAVHWREPRITIAGSEIPLPDPEGKFNIEHMPPVLSLDALTEQVEADGKETKTFHVARGLANDAVETAVLHQASKERVLSATTILSHFKGASSEAPDRRIDLIEAEGQRLLAEEPIGTRVTLEARPPALAAFAGTASDAKVAMLTLERTTDGVTLVGLGEDPKVAKGPVWQRYSWANPASRLSFARDARALAVIADVMLARRIGHPDYALHTEVIRAWPSDPVPITVGTMLHYRVKSGDKEERFVVLVQLDDGRPTQVWLDPATGRPAATPGELGLSAFVDPAAIPMDAAKMTHTVAVGDSKAEAKRDAPARRVAKLSFGKRAGPALVLEDVALPLLLSWESPDVTATLERVSPAARGRIVDKDTGSPVPHAKVVRTDVREEVRAGSDGSFAISAAPPMFRRVVLLLDKSGSMRLKLKSGETRIEALRKAAHSLFERWPVGLEVAVWTYSFDEVKMECDFTKDLAAAHKAVDGIEPGGATPLASAVSKVCEHVAKLPFPEHTVVLVMADGENTEPIPAAKAYQSAKAKVLLHTVGFAIEPGSASEKELTELAVLSGGTFARAGSGAALTAVFERLGESLTGVRLRVTSSCHAPAEITLTPEQAARPLEPIRLVHGCADCKCDGKKLLTINKKNLGDLERCEGLSPRAKRMIRERLEDGTWSVTIPSARVVVGPITAYGWLETEEATGRLVGRTEDGLHGAVGGPQGGVPFSKTAGALPFVAWYTGIVVYTAGSVDAMLRFHRQPNFLNMTPDDLKRYVQVHALQFASGWWNEVGSQSFPENINSYWSGVCLTYVMQSAALGLPNDGCHRHWAKSLCDQASDAVKGFPGEKVDDFLNENLGEDWNKLVREVGKRGFKDLVDEMKKTWEDGVDQGFDCERFQRTAPKKTSWLWPGERFDRYHIAAEARKYGLYTRGPSRHNRLLRMERLSSEAPRPRRQDPVCLAGCRRGADLGRPIGRATNPRS